MEQTKTQTVIPAERIKALANWGFAPYQTDCDLLPAFPPKYAVAIDTPMYVQGNHATDITTIFYAEFDKEQQGFFYAPSIIEAIMLCGGEQRIVEVLDHINAQTDFPVTLVMVRGIPSFFSQCDDEDWRQDLLRYHLSDMYKLVGQSDLLLPPILCELERRG